MKRILIALIFILGIGASNAYAQLTYLVDTHTPVNSYGYNAFKTSSSAQIAMSGGLKWRGGFTLSNSSGPLRLGYATFDLGGKYDKLLLVLGVRNHGMGAGGTGIDTGVRVFTVTADGQKILDTKVYPYGVPMRIELDVSGVSELKFSNVIGGNIAVCEATLWRAGQTPVETGNLITTKPQTIELVKELEPYFKNQYFIPISPTSKDKSFNMNGQKYTSGLVANMTMPLLGEVNGWAYFNLRKQYSKISFVIGPVDNRNKPGSGWFTVKADGKTIYEIETKYDAIAQVVTLDVEGCEMLMFHTKQASGTSFWGIGNIMAYPAGEEVNATIDTSTVNDRLSKLPDVCRLMSNIPPYSIVSGVEKQIYDGTSDYITFSMGGEKFSEGIVFYKKASFMDDNTSAHAIFDLGNEFDYISFTAGYIGKSGSMTNDRIRLYADDELIFTARLIATYPNQKFVVPINKCRKLRFENTGSSNLDVGAFGVGDLVIYRGEVVENDLFPRPIPDCPSEIELIDLGAPYIHYVSPMKNSGNKTFYDGSTIREYFDLNGERIYKGFVLQTSVHFSLDFGIFYNEDEEDGGSQSAAAATVGGAAVGSAFVAGGAAVGGAVVGSTLVGAAALLMLAAGGTAMESSCAAFNTYGQYNSVTFTVACCGYRNSKMPSSYKETLLVGADQKEVANIALYETMEPQTVTVPIDGCGQLLFFLANTGKWSGQYLFYDIKLSKQFSELVVPKGAIPAEAVVSNPKWSEKQISVKWEAPPKSGQAAVDSYLSKVSSAYNTTNDFIKAAKPTYDIHTYYLETDAGQVCKAVNLQDTNGNVPSISYKLKYRLKEIENLQTMKATFADLAITQASTMVSLPELGLRAISYGKIVRAGGKLLSECRRLVDIMIVEKYAEAAFLEQLLNSAIDIDGKQSSEKTIYSPLWSGETPPSDMMPLVRNFDAK